MTVALLLLALALTTGLLQYHFYQSRIASMTRKAADLKVGDFVINLGTIVEIVKLSDSVRVKYEGGKARVYSPERRLDIY